MIDNRRSGARQLGTAVLALLTLVVVASCSDGSTKELAYGNPEALGRMLSVSYDRGSEEGFMPQTVTITNDAGVPVVMQARFEVLGSDGTVLEEVRTRGIYGSERGNQVLMPGTSLDVLKFEGERSSDVRDVRLADVRATEVDVENTTEYVQALALDGEGRELDYGYRADLKSIELRSPNPVDIQTRIVVIVWENDTAPEDSQQALEVLEIGGLINVPADGETTVVPTPAQLKKIRQYGMSHAISIKAFLSR